MRRIVTLLVANSRAAARLNKNNNNYSRRRYILNLQQTWNTHTHKSQLQYINSELCIQCFSSHSRPQSSFISRESAPCVRVVLKTLMLSESFWIFFIFPTETDIGCAESAVKFQLVTDLVETSSYYYYKDKSF